MRFPAPVVRIALTTVVLAAPVAAVPAQNVTFRGVGTIDALPNAFPAGFTLGAFSFTFTLPQSPVVTAPGTLPFSAFTIPNVVATFFQGANTGTVTSIVGAFAANQGGGFSFGADGNLLISTLGDPIYTGSPTAPTFVLGDYSPTDSGTPQSTVTAFTIAPAAVAEVPEPSTVLLTGVGAVALGGLARRRRRAVTR